MVCTLFALSIDVSLYCTTCGKYFALRAPNDLYSVCEGECLVCHGKCGALSGRDKEPLVETKVGEQAHVPGSRSGMDRASDSRGASSAKPHPSYMAHRRSTRPSLRLRFLLIGL